MSAIFEQSGQSGVSDILLKVQEDLNKLKDAVASSNLRSGADIDLSALDHALNKTEEGIKASGSAWGHPRFPLDSNQLQVMQVLPHTLPDRRLKLPPALGQKPNFLKSTPQMGGFTPGQKSKISYDLKAMANPQNRVNRQVMNETYGIQMPESSKRIQPNRSSRLVLGSTIEPLSVLPKANRVDATLLPPPISETDARQGILSLIERGLIPPAAELTLEPNPVRNRPVAMHDPTQKSIEKLNPPEADPLAQYRIDPSSQLSRQRLHTPDRRRDSGGRTRTIQAVVPTVKPGSNPTPAPAGQLPPPTTPASNDYRAMNYRFAVHHGRVRESSSDFVAFKQHYCLSWGSIVNMLRHLETLCTNYSIPIAFINGDRLADLALEFELERQPSKEQLLSVVVNRDDVEGLIKRPGRRFLGPRGNHIAAMLIQASWKSFVQRKWYLEHRRKKWAAGVIAISWLMHIKMTKVRKQLKLTRNDQLEAFRRRQTALSAGWTRIKNGRRLVVHIPSLGYNLHVRNTLTELPILQNTQMSRLCDLSDGDVDVVYVSPVAISDETKQYYSKLLGLRSAVEAADAKQIGDVSERYSIIVPEAIKSFPSHNMCLSTLLKYSPNALKQLQNLTKGREAYIVPGMPHKDDLFLSDYLGLPVLGPEPEVAHLYSSKSGSKRIFSSAQVAMPPSEYDIYSLTQLHECLAALVTENLAVKRWLFKLDEEIDGRGTAVCEVADNLACYEWACKQAQRYGEQWNQKWAHESVLHKIATEIPEVVANFTDPLNKSRFPTWQKFLDNFLSKGGVIEAYPPSDMVATLTVDMLLEPDGVCSIISSGDQLHAESQYRCWGVCIPQTSVAADDLNAACAKVAEACLARKMMGYISIDFATFINSANDNQELWAIDLCLRYSDTLAMAQLFKYVSGGSLQAAEHQFHVPPPKPEKRKRRPKKFMKMEEAPNTQRFGICSTRLLHTNLAMVHYSVFFQMCRAHGIGYDVKEKAGTVFSLNDSFNREHMGVLAVGDSQTGALVTFARNLSVIHQEISAPNMQGKSNFAGAIKDIEGILGTSIAEAERIVLGQSDKHDASSESSGKEVASVPDKE